MKKLVFLTIIVLSVLGLQAQIKSFTIDGSKVYDNNTRTSYLTLVGELDKDVASIVTTEIKTNPDFKNFSFYSNPDFSKIMFTVDKSVTEQMVVDLINEIAFGQDNFSNKTERSFKKSDYDGKIYRVAFKLEDTPNLDNVKSATSLLKEQGNFEDISIIEEIHFELSSFEPISADFVIGVFEEFGLKIEEEFVK